MKDEIAVQEFDMNKATKPQLISLVLDKEKQVDQLAKVNEELQKRQEYAEKVLAETHGSYKRIVSNLQKALTNVDNIHKRRLHHIKDFIEMNLTDVMDGIDMPEKEEY